MIELLDALAASPMLPVGATIPAELLPTIARHRANLSGLVRNLRLAGMDDVMIESSVRQLLDSYRDELLRAVRTLIEDRTDG
ncbi:hypothetical protein [Sphingomonas sp.]|jgi:hypothetical protein|uniref:hypothetical protein n=1 Tax=Sphingomonas sp. TaxID=28214 RepID=UPI002ED8BE62